LHVCIFAYLGTNKNHQAGLKLQQTPSKKMFPKVLLRVCVFVFQPKISQPETLAACGVEELRVNLLLKENSYVSYIILNQSLILELKFYKLYVLICIMFSSFFKRALLYKLFYELVLFL
jgi:hypothetical protein